MTAHPLPPARRFPGGLTPRIAAFYLFLLAITVLHFWATSIQRVFVANGFFDDRMFLDLGQYIAQGQWLGPYDQYTLCKGPGYPLWLALVYRLHAPLLVAEQVLYILSCLLLIVSLRPLVRSLSILAAVYAIMAMNPVSMGLSPIIWLVFRENIYSSQLILLAACVIGVVTRINARRPVRWLWGIGAGLSLGAIFITREEGLWLVPFLAVVMAPLTWSLWKRRRGLPRLSWLIIPGRPLAIMALIIYTICTINYFVYGIFTVVDITEKNFSAAIGATQRVEHAHWRRMILVPKETRLRLYAVSPAFAQLEPFLESPTLGGRYRAGVNYIPELRGTDEFGGWWIWAVRHAAASIGKYSSANTARHYWRQVAKEINAAVKDGRLKGGPPGGVAPPWRREYLPIMLDHVPEVTIRLLRFDALIAYRDVPVISPGPDAALAYYHDVTHSPVLSNKAAGANRFALKMRVDPRARTLVFVYTLYEELAWPLAFVALLGVVVVVLRKNLRSAHGWMLTFTLGALLSVALRSALLIYIDVTSYPALDERYFGPDQTFTLLACTVAAAVSAPILLAFCREKLIRPKKT